MKGTLHQILETLKSSHNLELTIVGYPGSGYLFTDAKNQRYLIRTSKLITHQPTNTKQTYLVWPVFIRYKRKFDFLILGMYEEGELKYIFQIPKSKITFKATMVPKRTLVNRIKQGWKLVYRSWN